VQMVANSRYAWRATLPATTTGCQLTPATGDAVMYAYWSSDELGQTYVNIEARSAGSRTVSVTCGASTASFDVDIAAAPLRLAASCGPTGYDTGDLIDRGFYLANYPDVLLAGADLQFSAAQAGTYTITLTARLNGYGGPVLGTSSTTIAVGGSDTKTLGSFRWPSVVVPQNSTVAFSITQQTPGTLYYSVYQSFGGDPSCALMETEGTAPTLDQDRRRGVEANIYSALGPSY